MADDLCPTCHSKIGTDPENVREQGAEVEEDENGLPVPRWSNDPIHTRRGFSGDDFVGRDAFRGAHVKEIQEYLQSLEEELGFTEDIKTEFFDIDEDKHIRIPHLVQLRESIEKILDANGATLKEYFSLDPNGNEVEPGPNDEADKEEWTDVERGRPYLDETNNPKTEFTLPSGEVVESPSFPSGTRYRAIHIEDLRHPIPLGWFEFWSVSPEQVIVNVSPDDEGNISGFTERTFTREVIGFAGLSGIRETINEDEFSRVARVEALTDKNLVTTTEDETTVESGTEGEPGFNTQTTTVLIKTGGTPKAGEDLFPSDGGMRMSLYQEGSGEDAINLRTWLATVTAGKSERSLVSTFEDIDPGDPDPPPNNSGSTGEGSSSIQVEPSTDNTVLEIRENSNKAILTTHSEGEGVNEDSDDLYDGQTFSFTGVGNGTARIGHMWQQKLSSLYDFSPLLQGGSSGDNQRTRFLSEVEHEDREILIRRTTRFTGRITVQASAEGSGLVKIQLEENGEVTGETSFVDQNFIPNAPMAISPGINAPFDHTLTASCRMELKLIAVGPNAANKDLVVIAIDFTRRPDDPISSNTLIREDDSTAKFTINDSSFVPLRIEFNRGFVNGGTTVYDIDLNMDKLLERAANESDVVLGDSFDYVPNHILDTDPQSPTFGEDISNPDGSTYNFLNLQFIASSVAHLIIPPEDSRSSVADAKMDIEALRITNSARPE